jgi:hypothetical protein
MRAFTILMGLTATALASSELAYAPPEKSGQTTCFDWDGSPVSCAGTGQDGELRLGVTWPVPRFSDNGDGTVSDNLTGLIWFQVAECFGMKDWHPALYQVASFNGGSTACTNHAKGMIHPGVKTGDPIFV